MGRKSFVYWLLLCGCIGDDAVHEQADFVPSDDVPKVGPKWDPVCQSAPPQCSSEFVFTWKDFEKLCLDELPNSCVLSWKRVVIPEERRQRCALNAAAASFGFTRIPRGVRVALSSIVPGYQWRPEICDTTSQPELFVGLAAPVAPTDYPDNCTYTGELKSLQNDTEVSSIHTEDLPTQNIAYQLAEHKFAPLFEIQNDTRFFWLVNPNPLPTCRTMASIQPTTAVIFLQAQGRQKSDSHFNLSF